MKTKHTPKLIVLILSVMMIVSMFCVMTVSASAAETSETPAASITGKSVNLGGDISMKYYVTLADGTTIDQVDLKITFLGVETTLTETTYKQDTNEYVFTFTEIPPQCMGDTIYADVLVDGKKVGETVEYSVKTSLTNIYSNAATTAEMKQLVADTLKYGEAAQKYAEYKTDALVTNGLEYDEFNNSKEIPASFPTGTKVDGETTLVEANVLFSYMNFLKFRFTGADASSTATVGGEAPDTWTDEWYFYAQAKNGVEPFNFDEKYAVVLENSNINLSYSINDYCYAVSQNSSDDKMIALAEALYNYGLSAHIVKGNHTGGEADCVKGAECDICGMEYTSALAHNYTYTADEDANTITESCDQGCDHSVTVTLNAPTDLVYNGSVKEATDSVAGGTPAVNYDLNNDSNAINAGNYTASLVWGGKTVSVEFTIEKANASVTTAPEAVSSLTYTGSAHELVSAGSATGGNLVYSLSLTGEYTGTIPTGTDAGDYTVWYKVVAGDNNYNDSAVASVNVNIAKANATVTPPTANGLTYTGSAHELVSAGSATGGTIQYSLDNATWGAAIPTGINATTYTVYYKVVGDSNHNDTAVASINVTIAKANASVTPAPTAKTNLVANGSELELVTAGSANGGMIEYVLGTDAITAPTDGWGTSIPTGTTAGTYYVWYKVVGDDNHNDVAAQCVTVTISDHVHSWTYEASGDKITATCVGDGTCPTKTVTATIKATDATYTGSGIETATVEYDGWIEAGLGELDITYANNVNVGTATATISVDRATASVAFEIKKDPKTDSIDGEWVIIEQEPYVW